MEVQTSDTDRLQWPCGTGVKSHKSDLRSSSSLLFWPAPLEDSWRVPLERWMVLGENLRGDGFSSSVSSEIPTGTMSSD